MTCRDFVKNNFYIVLVICFFILASCSHNSGDAIDKADDGANNPDSSEEQETDNNNSEEQDGGQTEEELSEEASEEITDLFENLIERAPKEPKNMEEILDYPIGPLANKRAAGGDKDEMVEFIKEKLPPIENEELDENDLDKWWRAYRYLIARDYPDPRRILKELSFDSFGHSELEDKRFHFKEQMNVLVILDVSGSMANEVNGKPMMEIAKDSIREFTANLPDETNIGLRVYGHEGKPTGKTKEESCQSTELVYDIQPIQHDEFNDIIDSFQPTGWTPIGLSLEKAQEDFKEFPGDENTNLVYIVSDGAETCGGDPVKAAKELSDSDIQSIVNVIGFNVDMDGQTHLREIADAGNGIYTNAGDEAQLQEAFDQAEEMVRKWKNWKSGVQSDVYDQISEQRKETIFSRLDWSIQNQYEKSNHTSLLTELNVDDYITREAFDYMKEKAEERYELYEEIEETEYQDLKDEIEIQYEKVLSEISDEYDKNIDE